MTPSAPAPSGPAMPGPDQPPLAGLRVLELASILAGPCTAQFLAELGADVIKVENPATGGDPTRGWRLVSEPTSSAGPDPSVSAYFSCANWGKRSLALDISTREGRDIVHQLAARSDVVIASFKPGDDRKLALDPETLRALNPALIYAQISAYGRDDPRPGFDAIIQAESGFTHLNGEADGPATKMPVALVDLLAAHQLKEGILLALLERERGHGGRLVHVSLLGAAIASLANQASNYLVAGVVPGRMGSEHPNIVPYGAVYRLGDGRELVLAVGTERQWRALTDALGRADLAADPRYSDNTGRVRHRDSLRSELDAAFAGLDADSAARRLRDARVPFGFVNDMRAVFDDCGEAAQLLEHETIQGLRTFVAEGIARAEVRPPPAYNAHGRAILGELGYDPAQCRALTEAGVWPGDPPGAPGPETA